PARRIVSKHLGELLLERGIITEAQLEKTLKIQKEKGGLIGQILVTLGFVKEEEIAQALTIQYGFPYLPLECYDINKEAIKLIPENVAMQYNLVAIDKIGDLLTIAMSNPLNYQAIEDIETLTKCKVQVFVSTMTDINNAILKHYPNK
ncbi:MAG: type II secretion system protein GspE, partial [Candidatus Omnitrophica bacterium]|nr:type II secretion system protein GspE [Candidatus Omnitrophota bacterium]